MNPSINSVFGLSDLFGILAILFFNNVFFTLSSKEDYESAQKSPKIPKTLIKG